MPQWSPINFDSVANGLWVVIALLLSAIGIRHGWNRGEGVPSRDRPAPSVEVAGALIDTRHTQALIDALGLLTVTLTEMRKLLIELNRQMEDRIESDERRARLSEQVMESLERFGRDVRDLRDEIGRSNRRG